MKKMSIVALALLLMANLQAQYKKATFLNKSGRTYDFGATAGFIGKSAATAKGIYYSFGRVRDEKRFFFWVDLEFTLPTAYSYNAVDTATKTPVKVAGKSTTGFLMRYNFAYFLVDNSNAENKLLPFVNAGIQSSILSPNLSNTYLDFEPSSFTTLDKAPASSAFNIGANLGVGLVYKLSRVVGLKLGAGYNFIYNINLSSNEQTGYAAGVSPFYFYVSHPYASLGIRFTMPSRD
jgi:hypothetical protein